MKKLLILLILAMPIVAQARVGVDSTWIRASGDDGFAKIGDSEYDSATGTITFGFESTSKEALMRFQVDSLTSTTVIDSAWLCIRDDQIRADTVACSFRFVDADDPASPHGAGAWTTYNGYALTTAAVADTFRVWAANTWYHSKNLASILQELVNSSYSLGTAKHIIVLMKYVTNTEYKRFQAYDGSTTTCAQFGYSFHLSGGGNNCSPPVNNLTCIDTTVAGRIIVATSLGTGSDSVNYYYKATISDWFSGATYHKSYVLGTAPNRDTLSGMGDNKTYRILTRDWGHGTNGSGDVCYDSDYIDLTTMYVAPPPASGLRLRIPK